MLHLHRVLLLKTISEKYNIPAAGSGGVTPATNNNQEPKMRRQSSLQEPAPAPAPAPGSPLMSMSTSTSATQPSSATAQSTPIHSSSTTGPASPFR